MKHVLLFFCFVASYSLLKAQTLCPAHFDFRNQAEIDYFNTNYGTCPTAESSIYISGNDIINLDGLSVIDSARVITIYSNPLLTTLTGLSNIVYASQLEIDGNPLLSDLTGVEELSTFLQQIRIAYNSSLSDISSLKKATSLSGYLSVGGNTALTSLAGLENIVSITGDMAIGSNNALKNLDGLSSLKSIGGYFLISGNPSLTSLSGLFNLNSVGSTSYMRIINNGALTSLSGLDNADLTGITFLNIGDSNSLLDCGVKSICHFLTNVTPNHVDIKNNAAGCSSREDVLSSSSCKALPVHLVSFTGKNTIEGNLLNWQTSSETNNAGFSIEHSSNGKFFEETGFVKGNGNVDNQTKDYSFTDKTPGDITYYRLKQIDFDQTFTYSKIIVVKNGDLANAQKENTIVYPNPARGQLTIETKNRNQEYRIQSMQGVTLREESVLPSKPIDTSFLQDGLYMISVGKEVFKVVVNN